ncbi:hypothetical protein Tco_1321333 [Tanacetum coccineum]
MWPNSSPWAGHGSIYTPSPSLGEGWLLLVFYKVLAGFADEVIYSLCAKQSEDWDLLHEDLEQIDDLDIEEMDINWQIAMIAIRMKKFYKKTRRRVCVDGKHLLVLTKRSLNASIVTTLGEHTEEEETNHALMAISSSNEKMEREAEVKKQRVCNTVQLKTGRPNINSVRTNINTGRTNINSVMPRVNTVNTNVNTVRSRQPVPTRTSNSFSPKRPQGNWGSAVKTSAGYNWRNSKTPIVIEKDEDVELIVVPSAVKNTEEKVESRTSPTNSKKEVILTEPQQEKKASSTDTLEDNPKILALRRELEEIALKHLGTVSEK